MTGPLESLDRKLGSAGEAFWYSNGSTLNLGLFRILFATCLFREVGTTLEMSTFALEGGFHLPYVGFIQPVTAETYEWIHGLHTSRILPVRGKRGRRYFIRLATVDSFALTCFSGSSQPALAPAREVIKAENSAA